MIHNISKRIISTSSEFELLQMVSKPETPRGQQGRGLPKEVDCEIPHQLERGTKYFL